MAVSIDRSHSMKISARNLLKGTVKSVNLGAVNAEIAIAIAPEVEVTAVITKSSAESLGLVVGKEVYATIKSSDIMVAID